MPGSITSRHQAQPRTRRFAAASRRSLGNAAAPPIVLNTMYHCVPNTMRKLNQMSGLRWKVSTRLTAAPNSRLTGNAARNCANGCTASAQRGRRPIQTLSGTQIRLASAISTTTRSSVISVSPNTSTDVAPAQFRRDDRRRRCRTRRAPTAADRRVPDEVERLRSRAASAKVLMRAAGGRPMRSSETARSALNIGCATPRTQRVRCNSRSTQELSTSCDADKLDPEFRRPGDHRPEQQLIVEQDHHRHRQHRHADGASSRRASLALAMNEPTPGSVMVVSPTVIASEATTKNQPPDIDIIVFQISAGTA